jgi:hypothetical protein
MDADTAETVAGVVRLLHRAAELEWLAIDTDGAGSPRQLLAWASTWPQTRRGTSYRMQFRSTGRRRLGLNRPVSYGLLSSYYGGWPPQRTGDRSGGPAGARGQPGGGGEHR